jgi:diguanylate cyclase (GGDEF) domain
MTAAVYIGGCSAELHAKTIEQIIFAQKAEFFGGPFLSAYWLLISYKYLFKRSASLNLVLLTMIVPLITLFLAVTNEYHHFIYSDIRVASYEGALLAQYVKGGWYYVYASFSYAVQCFGAVVFFKEWRRKSYGFKTHVFWIFAGSVLPAVCNLIYISGLSPFHLDLTPFGLGISGILLGIAVFRFGFLDLQEKVKDVAFWDINEGILVVDESNRVIDFNQACSDIFNWLDLNQIGIDLRSFTDGAEILKQSGQHFEMKIKDDQKEKYYEFHKTPLFDQDKKLGTVYLIQDISGHKQRISKQNDIISYDSLTGIFNRERLTAELEQELHRMKWYGRFLSVLLVDIDSFKNVNEQYGTLTGDEVLKALANTCISRLRRTDIFGRFEGEKFLIILPETGRENGLSVAESIRKSIADLSFLSNGRAVRITVSIGVKTTESHENSITTDEIIKGAYSALDHAKESGRNRISAL